jgi:hypothetical protein
MLPLVGQILAALASLALLAFLAGPLVRIARRLWRLDDLDDEDRDAAEDGEWPEPSPSNRRRYERAREAGICGICGAEPGGWLKRGVRSGRHCPECDGWYCQRHVIESVTYHPPWGRRLREAWLGSSRIRHRCVYCGHKWTSIIHSPA